MIWKGRESIKKFKGLTLIEILVSIAILGILMIPLFDMSDLIMKINKSSSEKLNIGQIMAIYLEQYKSNPSNSYYEHLIDGVVEYKIFFEDDGEIAKFTMKSPDNLEEKTRRIKKINVTIKKLNKALNTFETVKHETILLLQ